MTSNDSILHEMVQMIEMNNLSFSFVAKLHESMDLNLLSWHLTSCSSINFRRKLKWSAFSGLIKQAINRDFTFYNKNETFPGSDYRLGKFPPLSSKSFFMLVNR